MQYPEIFLPWMAQEQKFSYNSSDITYQYNADRIHDDAAIISHTFYENKFYEIIIGSLIRHYLLSKNPNSLFYYTSRHDDYTAGCDYLVSLKGNVQEFVRIDLNISNRTIEENEHNYITGAVQIKMKKFHTNP